MTAQSALVERICQDCEEGAHSQMFSCSNCSCFCHNNQGVAMGALIADPIETVLGVRLSNAKRDSVEMMQSLARMQSEAHVTGRDTLAYDIATLWEQQQQITAQLAQIVSDERRTAVQL